MSTPSEECILNKIENYSQKLQNNAIKNIVLHGDREDIAYVNYFNKHSNIINQNVSDKIESYYKTHGYGVSGIPQSINSIIEKSKNDLNNLHSITNTNYSNSINTHTNNVIDKINNDIRNFTNNLVSKINAGSQLLAKIEQKVRAVIDGIYNKIHKILNLPTTIINKFKTKLKNLLDNQLKKLDGFFSLITTLSSSILAVKGATYNFFNRAKGLASTSQYIQSRVKDLGKTYKENKKALENTVDSKIIIPQLKKEIQKTIDYKFNPLAQLLGIIGNLLPTFKTKKIQEPKPTNNKAEYGKITVTETSAGYVKIKDSTPGNERVMEVFNKTGTYYAALPDGSYNLKVTGNKQDLVDKDWTIITGKDKIETIVGNVAIEIRKDSNSLISGNMTNTVSGKTTDVCYGNINNQYKSNVDTIIGKSYSESVGFNKTENITGKLIENSGPRSETIKGNLIIKVLDNGNINITSSNNININSINNISIGANHVDLFAKSTTINSYTTVKNNLDVTGHANIGTGDSGHFTTSDGKIVSVHNGIITEIL